MPSLPTQYVFIPALFEPLPAWQRDFEFLPDAPLLVKYLSGLKCNKGVGGSLLASIYSVLGSNTIKGVRSHASACYHFEMGKLAHEQEVLCASPIELEASMSDIVIGQQVINDLAVDERQQLLALLNTHFKQDGWQFEVSKAGRWFLRLPSDNKPTHTFPVDDVLGASLRGLVEGNDNVQWSRQLNELQMLLYSSPTNQQRESNRQRMINSFWLWDVAIGEATTTSNEVDFVAGGGYEGQVIASAYGVDWSEDMSTKSRSDGDSGVFIYDGLEGYASSNDMDNWQQQLAELEPWLVGLLDNASINTIVYTDNGLCWSSGHKKRWRFFVKREKSLLDLI